MTTAEKQDELIKRFGNKFYNELGDRVTGAQQLQGRKKHEINDNSMSLANQATDALWKEWVEDCVHEWEFSAATCTRSCEHCKTVEAV